MPSGSITPLLDCITDAHNRFVAEATWTPGFIQLVRVPEGDWYPLEITAAIGYHSSNSSSVEVPLGSQNFFTPGQPIRFQPTIFFPGLWPRVFVEAFYPVNSPTLTWFIVGQTLVLSNDPAKYCAASATLTSPTTAQPGQHITLDIGGRLLRPDHEVWLVGSQGQLQADVAVYHPRGLRASADLPANASGAWSVELRLSDNDSPLMAGAVSVAREPRQVNATLRTPAGTVLAGTESEGLFRKPAGSAWQQLDTPQTETRILSMAGPASGKRLFVGTDGEGLFISTDDGLDWQALTSLPATRVNTLQLLDGEGLALLAGTENGLFMTSNAGQSWQSALPEQP